MCQVHTGAYVSSLAPGKTAYTACHPRKTTTYISHVVYITTHSHNKRKSIGKRNLKTKKRTERKWVHGANKKIRKIYFGGSTGEAATRTGCHMSRGLSTVYSSSTLKDFRYTHQSTDYRPNTRSTAGRGCHVLLCWPLPRLLLALRLESDACTTKLAN